MQQRKHNDAPRDNGISCRGGEYALFDPVEERRDMSDVLLSGEPLYEAQARLRAASGAETARKQRQQGVRAASARARRRCFDARRDMRGGMFDAMMLRDDVLFMP